MTTFSVVQGSGAYVSNTTNNRTLTGITAGNILVAFVACRDGNASSGMSVSDDNLGSWNYVDHANDDNLLGDTNARFAIRKAWRVVAAGENGDNLVVTGTTAANNNGTFVAEIEPNAAFVPALLAASTQGSGTGSLDGVSTSTGSISGTDLLHVIIQGVRQGSAIGGFQTTQYTPTTEYLDYEYIAGSNQISGAIGVAIDGQTASGVVTATSDLLDPNAAVAEGIIAQFVFEAAASTDIVMNTGTVTVAGHAFGVSNPNSNQSDDFSSGTLDTSIWDTVNTPTGTSITFDNDGTDYWVELNALDATDRDLYDTDGLPTAIYMWQSSEDVDLDLRVRFLTTPGVNGQGLGITVYQDDNNFARFDFNYNGTNYFGWASRVASGLAVSRTNTSFGGTWYPYMRVTRVGDTWAQYRSSNGTDWTLVEDTWDQAYTINKIGLHIISALDSTGFTGKFDYFEDYTHDPISDEDAGAGTSIDMALGAVTVAGYATTEISAANIAMDAGAVTVAGYATTETENLVIAMDAGAVTVAGHDFTETASVAILMDAGALTVAGHATTETESVLLPMDAGAVVVSGYATTETESILLPMDAGAVTVAGHDFALTASVPIAMDAGAVVVSGYATTETESVLLPIDAGAFTVSGHDTTETESLVIAMDAGAIVVTGYDISLTDETSIAMGVGSVTVAGYSTTETENLVIAMAEAAVVVAGHDFTVASSVSIAMDAGAVTVAGYATTEVFGAAIAMDAGALAVAGYDTTEASVGNILMGAGVFTVTGYSTLDGIDLSPAPRLPRDDTEVLAGEAFGLGFMVSYTPVTGPFHLSLLQTRTPKHWVAPLDRQVYNWNLTNNFNSFAEAEAEAEPVLEEFAKDNPKPPQNRGVTT